MRAATIPRPSASGSAARYPRAVVTPVSSASRYAVNGASVNYGSNPYNGYSNSGTPPSPYSMM
jgi:hypothetical protein